MKQQAIIDNNVLANFLDIERIDILDKCMLLFDCFLIPISIKNELAAYKKDGKLPIQREKFLSKLNTKTGFYRLCDTYDAVEFMFLKTEDNIHEGEAEAIAQAQKRSIRLFFTEDKS